MTRKMLVGTTIVMIFAAVAFLSTSAALGTSAIIDDPDEPVPAEAVVANPLGLGESLVLVIGGVYDTEAETQQAAAVSTLGEFQGYYVAPTSGFSLSAVYASVRPLIGEIPCTLAGILDALLIPDLTDSTEEELTELCGLLQQEGQSSILLNLETTLERVPFVIDLFGKSQIIAPLTCLLGSRCLGSAKALLGTTGALPASKWMTVSAFRTLQGAEEFVTMIRDTQAGSPAMILQGIRDTGALDIGLGQEPNPDGTGAAMAPLPDQEQLQE